MDPQLTPRNILNGTEVRPLAGKDHSPHITHMPLQSISALAPFSALIISVIFVIYFIIRFYILEKFLLRKIYGEIYTRMDEVTRRGFVNHHIAGATKIIILIAAAYPFIDVAFGSATLHSGFGGSKTVTQGDILVVAAQALIAMYVFELFYRPKISPVSAGHHIGTIMIGQSAIAISLNLVRERDATFEFILCTVWGAFDIVSEFLPHVSIVLYRVYPTSHHFLRRIFCMSCITTLTGTLVETILTMYLFGSLWDRWTMAFKVTTPMLHALFASCQMWGSWNFYKMYQKQTRLIKMKGGQLADVEPASEAVELKSTERPRTTATERSAAGSEAPILGRSHQPIS